ncbi:alpha/beta hydrolase [Rhodococcus sp. D2-41]|uniref:alpha/beta fold hydrolase n=1 Tax=Speluncibacter jeojiensis TaxID=2710754 RepID=UPI00240F1499|nr:alpha/beta hydrolase [Rhodococcus sp. D2-41]MDG3009721.1 alpha/beta hydrolase [Rhodococcus sp. D2-41]
MTYTDLNGVRTHWDRVGDGEPVVLLHGGGVGADSWFAQTPALADAGFAVYLPERRGHGATPDVLGPFTYPLMARDTAAFLDEVVGSSAHIVGWSDGALVGALLAIERPDLVRRLVLIGQYYDRTGRDPDVHDEMSNWRDNPPQYLRDMYAALSPDGAEHFPVVFGKILDLWDRDPGLPHEQMARITAPTLIVQGDRDAVRIDYSAALADAMPDARLAVLPGTHALPVESPELVNTLLAQFLAVS